MLDEDHWLIWTSRPAPLKAGLRRVQSERGSERFPAPGEVLVDASDLDLAEKTLILFRHAKARGASSVARKLLRSAALSIVEHPHFTPERIRRFVTDRLDTLPQLVVEDGSWRVRVAVERELASPTEAMRTSFRALGDEHREFLVALLDAPAGLIDEQELAATVRRHHAGGLSRPPGELIDRLADHFLRITPLGIGWVHPSWRDLVIKELCADTAARRRFLGACDVPGTMLALSQDGGIAGERTLPLLVSDDDWDLLGDRLRQLVRELEDQDLARVLLALRGALTAEIEPAQKREARGLAEYLLTATARRWDEQRQPLPVFLWCERYGPIFRFDLGPRRVVAVSDLEEINAILRNRPEGFRRWREVQTVFAEMGVSGVFSEEGDAWRRQRRLSVTALNSNYLQRYFHIIRSATERLHHRLKDAARGEQALDIVGELTSLTVDVTSALAFGHDLNTLERRDNELQDHIQRTFAMLSRRILAPVPYWRWVRLPADRALERSLVYLHRAVEEFIAQARERMASRPGLREAPENFLEAMLAAQQAEGTFTDEEIIGNVFTLLLAGEDTTAHTMGWTLWFLASRPEIQNRWANEAREVLGEHLFPADYETIECLSYGEAVLRESMRLKPVAVAIPLESLADTTIAGTHIPAGTRLWLPTRHAGVGAVQRGNEFDPERWLNDDPAGAAPDQKSFLAFGAGPRFCPGRNLAFLQAKTAMAMLARNFELELDQTNGPVTELLSFTMIPKGLRVRLRDRTSQKSIRSRQSSNGTPERCPRTAKQ